jgi:hypothetical protein
MKHVPDRLDKVPATGRIQRRGVAALAGFVLPAIAAAAEPAFGDLPADIAKERPSASVPADLAGSRADPCAVYSGVQVFVPLRRGLLAEVNAASLVGAGTDTCAGAPAAAPPQSAGGGLPFGGNE